MEKTALEKYRFEATHNFDFKHIEILEYESNYSKRILSEIKYNH